MSKQEALTQRTRETINAMGHPWGQNRWAEDESNTQPVAEEEIKDHHLVAEGESFLLLTSLLSKFLLRKRSPPGS